MPIFDSSGTVVFHLRFGKVMISASQMYTKRTLNAHDGWLGATTTLWMWKSYGRWNYEAKNSEMSFTVEERAAIEHFRSLHTRKEHWCGKKLTLVGVETR